MVDSFERGTSTRLSFANFARKLGSEFNIRCCGNIVCQGLSPPFQTHIYGWAHRTAIIGNTLIVYISTQPANISIVTVPKYSNAQLHTFTIILNTYNIIIISAYALPIIDTCLYSSQHNNVSLVFLFSLITMCTSSLPQQPQRHLPLGNTKHKL